MDKLAKITILVAVCLLGVIAHAEDDKKKTGHWTNEIGDATVDFGGDESQRSERRAREEVKKISNDIQKLKDDVIILNKDLRVMEERLLFPSNTKFSVFVSMTSGQFFYLESIKLKINGRFVATHIYSEKQQAAMLRGGVHKLYITNLSEGKHDAIAFITGIGPGGRAYKRAVELSFVKKSGSQYLEVAITDDPVAQEPTFEMKQW
ncbi:hypothetical protein TDB9533_04200 [Thalassocella blandensis]|nr:hypothetical protein TDB9533_04200 [Thalassocella blandensis]